MTSGGSGPSGGPPDDDAAWAPPAAAPAPAPDLLPGYRDAVQIARGGDSVVYRAHQESVDRDVAVKVVLLDDPESIARFRRELDITVRLGRQHPNIMTVLAVGTTRDGQPCLVMDHFERGSLHDRLSERGPLPVAEAVAAGAVVADALAFAHAQGVLHRDVKPQNVLVLPTSYVLADFGLARAIDAGHSSSLERFSYRHASPQILDGEAPTVADDVYSLGSTLFTLLDGRPPFAADDPDEDSALSYLRRARSEAPRELDRADVPPALREIVMRCLAKRREDRFPGAAELHAALAAVPTESQWAPDVPAEPGPPAVPDPGPTAPTVDEIAAFAPPVAPVAPPVAPVAPPVVPVVPVAPGMPVGALPAPPAAAPVLPTVAPVREPEPVAVSALAHLGEAGASRGDVDATGRRPAEPVAPPTPRRRRSRWLPIGIGVAAALVFGVGVGVLRGGGDDPAPTPTPSRPSQQGQQPIVLPTDSGVPSGPTGSAIFDPSLAPTITTLRRSGTRVALKWTDPSKGKTPFVVYLDDGGGLKFAGATRAGVRSTSIENFPSGRHCVRVSALTTTPDGDVVTGLSSRKCVT